MNPSTKVSRRAEERSLIMKGTFVPKRVIEGSLQLLVSLWLFDFEDLSRFHRHNPLALIFKRLHI